MNIDNVVKVHLADILVDWFMEMGDEFFKDVNSEFLNYQGFIVKALNIHYETGIYFPDIISESLFSNIKKNKATLPQKVQFAEKVIFMLGINPLSVSNTFNLDLIDSIQNDYTSQKIELAKKLFTNPFLKSLKIIKPLYIGVCNTPSLLNIDPQIQQMSNDLTSTFTNIIGQPEYPFCVPYSENLFYKNYTDTEYFIKTIHKITRNVEIIHALSQKACQLLTGSHKDTSYVLRINSYMNGVHYNSGWVDHVKRQSKEMNIDKIAQYHSRGDFAENEIVYSQRYLNYIARTYNLGNASVLINVDWQREIEINYQPILNFLMESFKRNIHKNIYNINTNNTSTNINFKSTNLMNQLSYDEEIQRMKNKLNIYLIDE